MPRYDGRAELAPRDIVSRSIVAEMRRTGTRTVFLDMTALDDSFLKERFPKIHATCLAFGLNIATDLLPVSPASHYCMGGIRTDLRGRSTLPGLYAAGEVTCTGVHGANRLASNSLLEGLVFGARAGEAAAKDNSEFLVQSSKFKAEKLETRNSEPGTPISTAVRKRVKRIMWERVGIIRDRDSLARALKEFDQIAAADLGSASRSFVTLARLVAAAALWREESRGGHFRSDHPDPRDEWRLHSVQRKGGEIFAAGLVDFSTQARSPAGSRQASLAGSGPAD